MVLSSFVCSWLKARFAGLLALLTCLLGLRCCTNLEQATPGFRLVLDEARPADQLPYQLALRRLSYDGEPYRFAADTSRSCVRPNLQLKMLPQSRWHSAGAYLVLPRPRRPRQGLLDSAAAAARHE